MKSFIYTYEQGSARRGSNGVITVYQVVDNEPKWLGEASINSASYRGDKPTACSIISDALDMPMADEYYLIEDIRLFAL